MQSGQPWCPQPSAGAVWLDKSGGFISRLHHTPQTISPQEQDEHPIKTTTGGAPEYSSDGAGHQRLLDYWRAALLEAILDHRRLHLQMSLRLRSEPMEKVTAADRVPWQGYRIVTHALLII